MDVRNSSKKYVTAHRKQKALQHFVNECKGGWGNNITIDIRLRGGRLGQV